MDATTLIKDNLDVQAILEHYDFDQINSSDGMLRACCKIHGGNNPSGFVISPETGLFYCHTGNCGGGDVFTLVQKLSEVPFKEAVEEIASILHINIDNIEIAERKSEEMKELKSWTSAMLKRREKVEPEPYTLNVEMKEIAKFRDFSQATLEHFQAKFIPSIELEKASGGKYTLKDRIAVPILLNDIWIGLSLRKTKAKDYPKWSHQPRGLETRNILYNYDAVQGKQSIVIVEGMFDVWAFHEAGIDAVCTFGAHITEEQYKLLMVTGADLIFAFDGDEAGRMATNKAMKIFNMKANCFTLDFADGEDPASITREELKTLYESRRRL